MSQNLGTAGKKREWDRESNSMQIFYHVSSSSRSSSSSSSRKFTHEKREKARGLIPNLVIRPQYRTRTNYLDHEHHISPRSRWGLGLIMIGGLPLVSLAIPCCGSRPATLGCSCSVVGSSSDASADRSIQRFICLALHFWPSLS